MMYPYGPMNELNQAQLLDVRIGCKTRAEVLRNLGYSASGQNHKRLKGIAAELGVELPGSLRKGSTQGKSELTFIPGPPQTAKSVLPPRECRRLVDGVGVGFDPPAGPAHVTGYDPAGQADRLIEGNPLPPSRFQTFIDELETEIEGLQAQIDKRRTAQEILRSVDE